MAHIDKSEKYFLAREAIGQRAGIIYQSLDDQLMLLDQAEKHDEMTPHDEEARPVIKEMMNWLSLLLGVLYPEEMQDD